MRGARDSPERESAARRGPCGEVDEGLAVDVSPCACEPELAVSLRTRRWLRQRSPASGRRKERRACELLIPPSLTPSNLRSS